jgi:hypothetical protein
VQGGSLEGIDRLGERLGQLRRQGGAAAALLPRVPRKVGVAVWLITHARTRAELSALFPDDPTILYVEDSVLNRAMWQIGRKVPPRLSNFTFGFVSRIATQLAPRTGAPRRRPRGHRRRPPADPGLAPRPSLLVDLGAGHRNL